MKGELTAVIEPAPEGGFWAICLELPGANGQGESIEEAKQDLQAAIERSGMGWCWPINSTRIGRARRRFRLHLSNRALLGGIRDLLRQQIEAGFPFLPAGCSLQLDRVSSERVLANLRESLPSRRPQLLSEARSFGPCSLAALLAGLSLLMSVIAGHDPAAYIRQLQEAAELDGDDAPENPGGTHPGHGHRIAAAGADLHQGLQLDLAAWRKLPAGSPVVPRWSWDGADRRLRATTRP